MESKKNKDKKFKLLLIVDESSFNLLAKYFAIDDKYFQYQLHELKRKDAEKWDEFDERANKFLEMMNDNPDLF